MISNKFPKVSIIIPLYKKTPYFLESVARCLRLDYPDFEILIGTDTNSKVKFSDPKIKIIRTGVNNTGPAEKRDMAIRKSQGKYIAFLDDDSYPQRDWLKKAVEIANIKKINVICGPGLTPPKDNFGQKITGSILSSRLGSGPYFYRFTNGSPRYVDDYPAYNMIISRPLLRKIGGFGTKFYGGEDTAICLKIINEGEKILYHPDVVVYHHRRSFPLQYIKQVGNVGKHRGYFVKKYPQTSLRVSYFLPSFFTFIFPIASILLLIARPNLFIGAAFLALGLFYLILYIENHKREVFHTLILPFAIATNYIAYGLFFVLGLLFTRNLER